VSYTAIPYTTLFRSHELEQYMVDHNVETMMVELVEAICTSRPDNDAQFSIDFISDRFLSGKADDMDGGTLEKEAQRQQQQQQQRSEEHTSELQSREN